MVVKYQIERSVFYADYFIGGHRAFRGSFNLETCLFKFSPDGHRPYRLPPKVFYRLSMRFVRLCWCLFGYEEYSRLPEPTKFLTNGK